MSSRIQTDQIETHNSQTKEILNSDCDDQIVALTNTKQTETFTNEEKTETNNNQSYESFKNDASSGSGEGGDTNLLDDDLDFKLPEVDWINLEAKLKEAQQEINSQVDFSFISLFLVTTLETNMKGLLLLCCYV